jgi:signal peptidase I
VTTSPSDRDPSVVPDLPTGPPEAGDADVAGASEEGRTFRVQEPRRPSPWTSILSWGLTILIAVVATLGIRAFVFEQYSIPSSSMESTLMIGDRVIVSKLNKSPGRGDIIVFDRPPNDPPRSEGDPKVLIKRVIGLPGETVEARDGVVYVDGKRLEEDYLPADTTTTMERAIEVPEGHILVMGDNRVVSEDGRIFGPIDEDLIVGRAVLRIWPLNRFGGL